MNFLNWNHVCGVLNSMLPPQRKLNPEGFWFAPVGEVVHQWSTHPDSTESSSMTFTKLTLKGRTAKVGRPHDRTGRFSLRLYGLPDAVGSGEDPASSDVGAATVDLFVLLHGNLPLNLSLMANNLQLETRENPDRHSSISVSLSHRFGRSSSHDPLRSSWHPFDHLFVIDNVHVGDATGQLGLQVLPVSCCF